MKASGFSNLMNGNRYINQFDFPTINEAFRGKEVMYNALLLGDMKMLGFFLSLYQVYIILESFCCKKSPNQEIGLGRFWEQGTSEGSE